jgi:hypothetical protein
LTPKTGHVRVAESSPVGLRVRRTWHFWSTELDLFFAASGARSRCSAREPFSRFVFRGRGVAAVDAFASLLISLLRPNERVSTCAVAACGSSVAGPPSRSPSASKNKEVIAMSQHGQLIQLKRTGRDGKPLWAYRYRVGGRRAKRVQRAGLLLCGTRRRSETPSIGSRARANIRSCWALQPSAASWEGARPCCLWRLRRSEYRPCSSRSPISPSRLCCGCWSGPAQRMRQRR